MDPPDSTEANFNLQSEILDEDARTDANMNDLEEFWQSISSDCKYSSTDKDHETNDGYGFHFSEHGLNDDSDSLTSDSCAPKPSVPVISEVAAMIEKLKGQNKEMKDRNLEQEVELSKYEERLAEKMSDLLKIQMERDTLKNNLAAAECARANLELKLGEKEAELKQFRGLVQKNENESSELLQLRKDAIVSSKSLKKLERDLAAANTCICKKSASVRKLKWSNRKLRATTLEFGSILEEKGLLTQKQLKCLKSVKEETLTENNSEIKEENNSADEDIQNNKLNCYSETESFNPETLISTGRVGIKTECDYGNRDSFCNGPAIGYSFNQETLNSDVNGEGLHSYCNDGPYNSSLKPHQLSNSSEAATFTSNLNHLQADKKPLNLLNKNLPVKYSTDSSQNAIKINSEHIKGNVLSSNVENVQNNSSLFVKSKEPSSYSNFLPICAPKSESVCSEDFMEVREEDFNAMELHVWPTVARFSPLSPLPPTPPPRCKTEISRSICKTEVSHGINKARNHCLSPVPSTSSGSKDTKMSPKSLDKRSTLYHQTSKEFEPQIDKPSAKPVLPFNEQSVSRTASDNTLPSNLYYISSRQVNDSFLINGFGNGHLEYLLDFKNGHSVMAVTPNNSESTSLNQIGVNTSVNSQDSPLIHANLRLGLLLSHYKSYNEQMLSNSQNSIPLPGQESANSKFSEKFHHSTPIYPKTELKPVLSDNSKFENSMSAFASPQKAANYLSKGESSPFKCKVKVEADDQFFVSSSCDSSTPSKRKLKQPFKTHENIQKSVGEEKINEFGKLKRTKTSQNSLEADINMQEHDIDIKRRVNVQNRLNWGDCSNLLGIPLSVCDNVQSEAQSKVSSCSIPQIKSECGNSNEFATGSMSKISEDCVSKEKIDASNFCRLEEPAPYLKDPPASKDVLDSEMNNNISYGNVHHLCESKPELETENNVHSSIINQSTVNMQENSTKSNLKAKKNKVKRQRQVQLNETNVENSVSPIKVEVKCSTSTLSSNPSDDPVNLCSEKIQKPSKKKPKLEFKPTNKVTSLSVITNPNINDALNGDKKNASETSVFKSDTLDKDNNELVSKNISVLSTKKIDKKSQNSHGDVTSKSVLTQPCVSMVTKPKCSDVPSTKEVTNDSVMLTRSKKASLLSTKNNGNKIKKSKSLSAIKKDKKKKKRQRKKRQSSLFKLGICNSGKNDFTVKSLPSITFSSSTESEIKESCSLPKSSCVNGNFDSVLTDNEQNNNQHTAVPEHEADTKDINANSSLIPTVKPIQSTVEATPKNSFLVKAEVHNIHEAHNEEGSSSILCDTEDLPNKNYSIKSTPIISLNSKILPLSPGLFSVKAKVSSSLFSYITFKNGEFIGSTKNEPSAIHSPMKSPVKKENSLNSIHSPIKSPVRKENSWNSIHSPIESPVKKENSIHSPIESPVKKENSIHSPIKSPVRKENSIHSPIESPVKKENSIHSPIKSPVRKENSRNSIHSPIESPVKKENSIHSPIKSPVKKESSLNSSASLERSCGLVPDEPISISSSPKLSAKGERSLKITNLDQNFTPQKNSSKVINNEDKSSPGQFKDLKQDSNQIIHRNGDAYLNLHIQKVDSKVKHGSCHDGSDDEHALIIAEEPEEEVCTPHVEVFENKIDKITTNTLPNTPKMKNKKTSKLAKNAQKKLLNEPADGSLTISKAFQEIEKLKFDESLFKHCVHTLVNALINPANTVNTANHRTVSLLFYVIQFLSCSKRIPLMTFNASRDSTALFPLVEKCIVTSLIKVDHKRKSDLEGLLSSTINALYLLVLAKHSIPIYGLSAFCRVFTAICKHVENSKKPISLCSDLLKIQHKFAPYLIATIVGVWPELFAVCDGASGVELMYKQSIIFGVNKKPQSLTATQWKHCLLVFSEFLTLPSISNVTEATNDLIEMIESVLEEEPFEEEYMLTDSLVIFAAHESWEWCHENLLDNFVLPHLAKYAQKEEENEKAFNFFCTLYSEIGLFSPDCDEPIALLTQFFCFSKARDYVKPIAARSLIKFLLLKNQIIPSYLYQWIQENESSLPKSDTELLLRRRLMSDSVTLTVDDVVTI